MGAMNAIEILDETTRRVRIEPGARWMDVAAALEPYGWALSSGDYGGVGVGGLATAGGIGWLVREHGLTIDHLRSADIVLADGSLVRASADENPDLFWAIRGAGANFGVVVSFEFEVDEVGEVGWAQLAFDASDTAQFVESWGTTIENSPRDVTSFLIMGPRRRGAPATATMMAMIDSSDPDVILERLQPFAVAGPLVDQSIQLTTYAAVMANASDAPHGGQGEPSSRSAHLERMTPEFAKAVEEMLATGDVYFFQLRSTGGAVNDVDVDATAYGNRSANFSIAAIGADAASMDAHWEKLASHFSGFYISFDSDPRPGRVDAAYPAETMKRLRRLKAQYDPANVFRDNFNILPETAAAV